MAGFTDRLVLPGARRIIAAYGVALAFVLYTPLTDWAAWPLFPAQDAARADAIVVLSAWANPHGELNESGLRRNVAAARLYRSGVALTVLVTGGRPTRVDEGDALDASVRFLRELGVPPKDIVVEDQSANTRDSAVNVARLSREHGWRRLVLVTDGMHMRRTRLAFVHEGLAVTSEPTQSWMIEGDQPSIRLAKLGAVVHEYGGLAYYWARGWI